MGLMNVDRAKRKEIKVRFSLDALKNRKINQLQPSELGRVYLAILEMKTFHIYLIDDITKGMPLDFCIALRQKLTDLFDAGSIILFLSTEEDFMNKDRIRAATEFKWLRRISNLKDQEAEKSCDDSDE
jgi:translation initiation factor RLI1